MKAAPILYKRSAKQIALDAYLSNVRHLTVFRNLYLEASDWGDFN